MKCEVRPLTGTDPVRIAAVFELAGQGKPAAQFETYLAEQERGDRAVLVAEMDDEVVGYVTVVWESGYVPDARGLTSGGRHVVWGESVKVDDDLVLYLTRRLRG